MKSRYKALFFAVLLVLVAFVEVKFLTSIDRESKNPLLILSSILLGFGLASCFCLLIYYGAKAFDEGSVFL